MRDVGEIREYQLQRVLAGRQVQRGLGLSAAKMDQFF